jgi:iron(III) transport system substrate-binding protein
VAEARAGRVDVDVFDTNGPDMEALAREGILVPVWSRTLGQLVPEARLAHGLWVGTRLNVFAFAYNTSLVKKAELPASYEALADPRWKGRLGIEGDDADWFAAVSGLLGEEKASKLFRDVVATNRVSVRKGHSLLANLVAAGEIPLALDVYNYKAQQLKDKGAPIDWFVIEPAIAQVNGVGVAARAAHPNAALLWYEFEIGEDGQRLLLSRSFVPTNRAVETPLNKFTLRLIDARTVQDGRAKWESRYAEVLRAGGR